jgi:hypothetical protein
MLGCEANIGLSAQVLISWDEVLALEAQITSKLIWLAVPSLVTPVMLVSLQIRRRIRKAGLVQRLSENLLRDRRGVRVLSAQKRLLNSICLISVLIR